MASNERFQCDFNTMDSDRWMVSIIDTDFSGTATQINLGMDSFDGFTLTYEGEGSERFNPIITSKCTISVSVIPSYQTAFETFIDDLVNADEERFFIVVYKHNGSSWDFHWRGIMLQDLITMDDLDTPYMVMLEANDGIGRLNDIDIDVDVINTNVRYTFIELLTKILSETGITDLWGSSEDFLRTAVTFYEESMYTTAPGDDLDPLVVSRVLSDAFYTYDEDKDEYDIMNCYDALDNICRLFAARITQVNGVFYIISINNYSNNTFAIRNYYKDGTANSYSTGNDFRVTDHNRTGMYQYMPILQRVELMYVYKATTNPLHSLIPDLDQYETAVSIGEIQGGTDETFLFSGVVEMNMDIGDPSPSSDTHRWIFDMRINVGSYYLTNKNGTLEWTTTSTDRVRYYSGWFIEFKDYNKFMYISFETPIIPTQDSGMFEFDHIGFEDENGDAWTVDPLNTATYQCNDFILRMKFDDDLDEGKIEFYAENASGGSLVKATSKLQLPDIIMGDGPHDYSHGAIQVYTTGFVWQNSDEEWTIDGDTTGYNINELCCIEALAGQRKAPRLYSGEIMGDFTALSVIMIDSVKYVFMGGSFNANTRTWDGEWFEMSVSYANINSGFESVGNGNWTDVTRRVAVGDNFEQVDDKIVKIQRAVVGDVRLYYDASTGLVKIQTSTDNGVTWSDSGTEWEL